MDLNTVIFALLGGVLPSVLWLWFWLREDKKNPEPSGALLLAFFAGVLSVFISIALEKIAKTGIEKLNITHATTLTILSWATIEESVKFALAWGSSLRKKYNDEPVDALIYMITVALGFAAAENFLFLLDPIAQNQIFESILTGNMRFLGATLLHILASSVIGAILSLSYYKSKAVKRRLLLIALPLAISVHFAFNYSISELDVEIMKIFAVVWVALVFLLLLFEKVKRMNKK